MSLYKTPAIDGEIAELLAEADRLRARVGATVTNPERWVDVLRRQAEADAYASSTEIEGFRVEPRRVVPVVGGASPESEAEEALAAYTHAMRHVGVMASDPHFEWSTRVLLDLHFDACSFQTYKHPGLFRKGGIYVTDSHDRTIYTGPGVEEIDSLVTEFIDWLERSADLPPLVAGAMAHLQLVSLHPFEDGNGRISRIVQSFVLALRGETVAELGSIEPFLARNTLDYYRALESVQRGNYDPSNDASPWLNFCLRAQIEQATLRESIIVKAAKRWEVLESIVHERDWPERIAIAMERSLVGQYDRSSYADEADVSLQTATNDLRRLVDAGLVQSEGAARSTHYVATKELSARIDT